MKKMRVVAQDYSPRELHDPEWESKEEHERQTIFEICQDVKDFVWEAEMFMDDIKGKIEHMEYWSDSAINSLRSGVPFEPDKEGGPPDLEEAKRNLQDIGNVVMALDFIKNELFEQKSRGILHPPPGPSTSKIYDKE
jgi:hypothetical protein